MVSTKVPLDKKKLIKSEKLYNSHSILIQLAVFILLFVSFCLFGYLVLVKVNIFLLFGPIEIKPSYVPPKPSPSSTPSFYTVAYDKLKVFQCDNTPDYLKFDCFPDNKPVNETLCVERGCCWAPIKNLHLNQKSSEDVRPLNIPYCYFPSDYPQYTSIDINTTYYYARVNISRKHGPSFVPKDVNNLVVEMYAETSYRLRIKIYDPNNPRYEVPYPTIKPPLDPNITRFPYHVFINPDPFQFAIIRMDNREVIFNSSVGAFIFADQFIQFSAKLSSPYIYGLGESHDNFMHNIYWSRFTLFNHDISPEDNMNLYGSHAFYLNMENSGKANGVFLFNSNAMDITLQPTPAITYRTTGGILDFYFFLGPEPGQVISQYAEIIGLPFLPPYWSLGFHLCRYNYMSLNNTMAVWKRNVDAGIPFDTQWNDIDYMDSHKDFTVDNVAYKDLGKFVDHLHSLGMHYMVIIDPGISASETPGSYEPYDLGLKQNVFIQDVNGQPFKGKVWTSGSTVWVDFTSPNATDYWTTQFQTLYNQVHIDGAWIDMNEPSNFFNGAEKGCPNTTLDYPFYIPAVAGDSLSTHTICMSCRQYLSNHYNLHNLYGLTESISTYSALTTILGLSRRPFIISRSSAPGLGHYAGHWTGDVFSTFLEMKRSIAGILNFNIFGIPMVGADICGFLGNTTQELCQRWMELGAFYPFSRNHNDRDNMDQDPASFNKAIIDSSRNTLSARYSLLPYLYTLFWRSHLYGETVARALFFEFPEDKLTYFIDEQFLWGAGLLISPVLNEGQVLLNAYFPATIWYDFWTGEVVPSTGTFVPLQTPLDKINLHVRGGYILPMQKPEQTTTASRDGKFWLLAALNESNSAYGELFWDHGDQIDSWEKLQINIIRFTLRNNQLWSQVDFYQYDVQMILGNVTILGVPPSPSAVTVNHRNVAFRYVANTMVLYITDLVISLRDKFMIQWS